ncbi:MAG: amidohydrolase [Candidatus Wallbacteria bacterium]|nr:amidohydrolase [Candidatus Wallbacteria bacterium]
MTWFRNAHILHKNGEFGKSDLLIRNGRIDKIGKYPGKGDSLDCSGLFITPGLIDAHCHIAIVEDGVGKIGWQENEATEPVTPHLRAIDAIYPDDMALADALAAGITSGMITPGSANLICGTTAVLKFHGKIADEMVVLSPAGMKMALGENPFRCYGERDKLPSTRMGNAALIRETLFSAVNYLKKKNHKKKDKDFDPDFKMECLIPVIEGRLPVRMHAHRSDDIVTAVRIAKEFNLRLSIEHCTEGHKIADFLAENKISCIIGPNISSREKLELRNRSFATPYHLFQAGVKFAFMTDHPIIPIGLLPLCASLAVKAGLPKDAAYRALTVNSAEICGVSNRIGRLEPGLDADFVIWDREPLEFDSLVLSTYINGECVFERKST